MDMIHEAASEKHLRRSQCRYPGNHIYKEYLNVLVSDFQQTNITELENKKLEKLHRKF